MILEIPSDDLDEAIDLLTTDEVTVYPVRVSQILFSVWNQFKGHKIRRVIQPLPATEPWVVWANESLENYELLWNFGMDIIDEHARLYGDVAKYPYKHGSSRMMEELGALPPLPSVGLTEKPKATLCTKS